MYSGFPTGCYGPTFEINVSEDRGEYTLVKKLGIFKVKDYVPLFKRIDGK